MELAYLSLLLLVSPPRRAVTRPLVAQFPPSNPTTSRASAESNGPGGRNRDFEARISPNRQRKKTNSNQDELGMDIGHIVLSTRDFFLKIPEAYIPFRKVSFTI